MGFQYYHPNRGYYPELILWTSNITIPIGIIIINLFYVVSDGNVPIGAIIPNSFYAHVKDTPHVT
jgi:hypothetical protein